MEDLALAARDKCAIVGIGKTEYSKDSGRSTLALATEAARAAIADAGLSPDDIDGIVRCDMDRTMPVSVAAGLGLRRLHFWGETGPGGTAPSMMIGLAVAAVLSGQAKAVVVYRSLNGRSEDRFGSPSGPRARAGGFGSYDELYQPYGLLTPGQHFAMMAQRHMHEYGTKQEHLGAIAIACREAANRTPHAQMHDKPLTMEAYLASRPISLPLRLFDFCLESDGACAVVVTTTERARDLAKPPVTIRAVAGGQPSDTRAGMMFPALSRGDVTDIGGRQAAEELWRRAGLGPQDMDFAQLYDCFTISVLLQLEAFGFCRAGEGGPFAASGAIARGGSIPINTAGGNMSEGYMHGLNHFYEAVRQLRGEADNQVEGAQAGLVTSGLYPFGSAVVLGRNA
ncbi:thiolase C-terminal domain-containing protein [Rhizorhabdus dicambivorans]|uniref:Lipid-transfer protein n=2 Tax=Rhizorhabdus dicambivorans TaxID=1850238 RepID=A0A2A4FUK2_9SPHN|nr:lipid-transfer protein [Rhizorhabdus dicambivorans]ATE67446.1 lipid-transfer protein [Rhizorhabdus dicambivorans]PCE41819.1 lipid-transfer protein [Rhizorhabdus dicambivorans]